MGKKVILFLVAVGLYSSLMAGVGVGDSDNGRIYNTLFIDVSTTDDPTFISDYIRMNKRTQSLGWKDFSQKLLTRPNTDCYLKISGWFEVPKQITSEKIIIKNSNDRYYYITYDGNKIPSGNGIKLIINKYNESRMIPFTYYEKWNTDTIRTRMDKYLKTFKLSISNKPTKRGEKEHFYSARFFIEE